MTGDLHHVPFGALPVRLQLRAELAHNFTNSSRVITEGACAVPPSRRLRETTDETHRTTQHRDGLTLSWDDPETAECHFLRFLIHTGDGGYAIRELAAAPKRWLG